MEVLHIWYCWLLWWFQHDFLLVLHKFKEFSHPPANRSMYGISPIVSAEIPWHTSRDCYSYIPTFGFIGLSMSLAALEDPCKPIPTHSHITDNYIGRSRNIKSQSYFQSTLRVHFYVLIALVHDEFSSYSTSKDHPIRWLYNSEYT